MDRFKFRAWDKESQEYYYDAPAHMEKREYYPFGIDVGFSHYDPDAFVIEQCVGTRDSQLELIWEGDVLEHISGRRAKVVWKDNIGMFDLEALNDIGWVDDSICWWKWEKVGTVHDGQGGNG